MMVWGMLMMMARMMRRMTIRLVVETSSILRAMPMLFFFCFFYFEYSTMRFQDVIA